MIVKNKRLDLIYKAIGNTVMVHDSLNFSIDIDSRFIYALISNFDDGIDVEYLLELVELKGINREELDSIVKYLLDLELIEDITNNTDLDKMKLEFEIFKKSIGI